jgi:hypothetical protein
MSNRFARRLTVLAAVVDAGLLLPAATLAADFPGTPGPDHLIGTADADKIWAWKATTSSKARRCRLDDGGADHVDLYRRQ